MITVETRNNVTYLPFYYSGERVLIEGTSALNLNGEEETEASLPKIRLTSSAIEEFAEDKNNKTPKPFLDVRNLRKKDIGKILAECQDTPELDKRISVFELRFDKEGNPLQLENDGSYSKMKENAMTKLDSQEILAMQRIRELSLMGYRSVAWFSPSGGSNSYKENRITVAVLKNIESDGSMVFDCRGICTKHNKEDFYGRVGKLLAEGKGSTLSVIRTIEDLRDCPIGLNLRNDERWFNYLASVFDDIPEVFEAIAWGRDVENMARLEKVAEYAMEEFKKMGAVPKSFLGAVVMGARLERFMREEFDMKLMAGGAHGSSNESILGQTGIVSEGTPGAKYCSHCGLYYIGEKCPVCKK